MSVPCGTKSHADSVEKDDLSEQFPGFRRNGGEFDSEVLDRGSPPEKEPDRSLLASEELRNTQDSSCLLRIRHFPSELFCDPNNPLNEFLVTLGENTF